MHVFQCNVFQQNVFQNTCTVEPESSHVWKRRSKRGTILRAEKPTTDYRTRLRLGVNAVVLPLRQLVSVRGRYDAPYVARLQATVAWPAKVSIRIEHDGLYFAKLQTIVDWPEADRAAIAFIRGLDELPDPPETRYEPRSETVAAPEEPDHSLAVSFLQALDELPDRVAKPTARAETAVSVDDTDYSLAASFLQSLTTNYATKGNDYRAHLKFTVGDADNPLAADFLGWLDGSD